MNERYEQLMAQAWIEFAPDAKAVTKRFAELIVRECARIVNDNDCEGSIVGDGMLFEHFGVK